MILFFSHIPTSTVSLELTAFVEPALRRRLSFLPVYGHVIKSEILALQDSTTGADEYHGLVYLDSPRAVQVALERLRGQPFKNQPIEIHQYQHRDPKHDRRIFEAAPKLFADLRHGDRRRGDAIKKLPEQL